MKIRVVLAAMLLAGTVTMTACTHNGSSTPSTPSNISGDYTGTVQDSVSGTLSATAILAQHGGSAGGTLSTTAGSTTLNSALSLVISSSNALSGTMVQDLPDGTTCTFHTSGTYNTSSQQISGSYTAVTGCTSQSGTYTLSQQCTDTVTSVGRRRAMGVPKC